MTKLEQVLKSALRCALNDLEDGRWAKDPYHEPAPSLAAVRHALAFADAQAARENQTPRPHYQNARRTDCNAEGWAWPDGSPNCAQHYFRQGQSLCGRYGRQHRGTTPSPVLGRTCKYCRQTRAKEVAKEVAQEARTTPCSS